MNFAPYWPKHGTLNCENAFWLDSFFLTNMFCVGRHELFQSTPLSKSARTEFDVSPVVPVWNEEDTNTLWVHTFYITTLTIRFSYMNERLGECIAEILTSLLTNWRTYCNSSSSACILRFFRTLNPFVHRKTLHSCVCLLLSFNSILLLVLKHWTFTLKLNLLNFYNF